MTRRTFSFIAWVVTDWLNSYLSPAPYKCWILIFPKWNLCAYAIILCDLSPWSVKSIQQKSASEPSPIKNSRNVPLWILLGSELLRKMLLRTCSLHGTFSISVYYIGDIWLGLHKKVTLFRDTCNKRIIKKYQKDYYSNNYSIVWYIMSWQERCFYTTSVLGKQPLKMTSMPKFMARHSFVYTTKSTVSMVR